MAGDNFGSGSSITTLFRIFPMKNTNFRRFAINLMVYTGVCRVASGRSLIASLNNCSLREHTRSHTFQTHIHVNIFVYICTYVTINVRNSNIHQKNFGENVWSFSWQVTPNCIQTHTFWLTVSVCINHKKCEKGHLDFIGSVTTIK